jgi:hypothetical protein
MAMSSRDLLSASTAMVGNQATADPHRATM